MTEQPRVFNSPSPGKLKPADIKRVKAKAA